jgi:hypothetical protein
VTSFNFDREQLARFTRLSSDLYRGDPHSPPDAARTTRRDLSRGSYLSRAGAPARHFVATAGGSAVGRASAFYNERLTGRDGAPVGGIGFFECVDDITIAEELLGTAAEWLRHEYGLQTIWAPINFDIWHGYRCMTRGFERPRFMGEPYNKPYYRSFFSEPQWHSVQRWHSFEVTIETALTLFPGSAEAHRRFVADGYTFISCGKFGFTRDLRRLHRLVGDSFGGFFGYTAIDWVEFKRRYGSLRYIIEPDLFALAIDPHGKPVGFAGVLPDATEAIRSLHNPRTAHRALPFILDRGRNRRAIFFLLGTGREPGERLRGLGRALYQHVVAQLVRRGYETLVCAIMAEDSLLSTILQRQGHLPAREYVLFETRT